MANIVRYEPDRAVGVPTFTWDPFRLMREMLSWDPFRELGAAPGLPLAGFAPSFEVKETGDGYTIQADLPGVEEKDVDVTLTANRLTISGKREAERREEGATWYTAERSFGAFSRSFTLPEGIDAEQVTGELRNGVLTVFVPKRAEVRPRKISLRGVVDKVKSLASGERGKA